MSSLVGYPHAARATLDAVLRTVAPLAAKDPESNVESVVSAELEEAIRGMRRELGDGVIPAADAQAVTGSRFLGRPLSAADALRITQDLISIVGMPPTPDAAGPTTES
jgi:hypothetical protein